MSSTRRMRLINTWCEKRHPPFHTCFLVFMCIYVYESDNSVYIRIPLQEEEHFYNYFATAVSHFSTTHLLSNVLGIILFGTLVEIVHGTFASVCVYWISAGTGVLSEAYWNPGTNVVYTGASPGVYALVGAYLAHILLNWNEAPLRLAWAFFLVIQGVEIAVSYALDEDYRDHVAHFSHLFGFLQGVFVGMIVLRNLKVLSWEVALQGVSFVLSVILILSPVLRLSAMKTPQ